MPYPKMWWPLLLVGAGALCPAVPEGLPNEAIQDCGEVQDGGLCPFNCSNARSGVGRLLCQNGAWQVDPADPPRCVEPCFPSTVTGYGQSVAPLGYLSGFWASPSEWPTTTTTMMPCDTEGASECLQRVVAITDIQEFCSRLPGAVQCLAVAGCCLDAADTISGSIDSCAAVGRAVENPCGNSKQEQCLARCVPQLASEANVASCTALHRVPLCLRSMECCGEWPALTSLTASCRSLGFNISSICEDVAPTTVNEGGRLRLSCEAPRYANGSVTQEDYLCQNGSLTSNQRGLQCLDPSCALPDGLGGVYECFLEGQGLALAATVPMGAVCRLRCAAGEAPRPPADLVCAYGERDYPEIIYSNPALVSRSGVARMVHREANGTLWPVTTQACVPEDCALPSLPWPVVLLGNRPEVNATGEILYVECSGTSQSSRCEPVCAHGSRRDPARGLLCDGGGFQGAVRCVPQSCEGLPAWPFANTGTLVETCSNSLHGESCEVQCLPGYARNLVAGPSCEAGVWSVPAEAPCDESPCTNEEVRTSMMKIFYDAWYPGRWDELPTAQIDQIEGCASPAGSTCAMNCGEDQRLGSLLCARGSYELQGLGCIPAGATTRSVPAVQAQVELFSDLTGSLRGTVASWVAASALEPLDLGRALVSEVGVSPLDLGLELMSLDQPLAALAAASALPRNQVPKAMHDLVELGLSRMPLPELWDLVSMGLLRTGASDLDLWFSSALQRLRAEVVSFGEDVSLELRRVQQLLLAAPSIPSWRLQEVEMNMEGKMELQQQDEMRIAMIAAYSLQPEPTSRQQLENALAAINFDFKEFSATPAPAAMALQLQRAAPWAPPKLLAQTTMQGAWQLWSGCTDTALRCERQRQRALVEAGRSIPSTWRFGSVADVVVEDGFMLAGALSVIGVYEEDLIRLGGTREAFQLSQVSSVEHLLEILPSFTVSGIDLGMQLDLQLSPLQGELALQWTGDAEAGAVVRTRRAGASDADLLSAYLAAAQVPVGSRSARAVAATIAAALPLQIEGWQRCSITRAVSLSLGMDLHTAAQAAALSGVDLAGYEQGRVSLQHMEELSAWAQQLPGSNGSFQGISLAFALALDFYQVPEALQAALLVEGAQNLERSVSRAAHLGLCVGASLPELARALILWMPPSSDDLILASRLLGQASMEMKEVPESPIFRSAALAVAVALAERRQVNARHLWSSSLDFSESSWASWVALRVAEQWKVDGGDLAAQVKAQLGQGSVSDASAAAHLAALHAGLDPVQIMVQVLGHEDAAFFAGFWAAKWPPRQGDVVELATASHAVVKSFQAAGEANCSLPQHSSCSSFGSSCSLDLGLSPGLNCSSYCAGLSTFLRPRRCLGMAFNCTSALLSCDYAVTQEDVTQHQRGFCVCSGDLASLSMAAANARGLARFHTELESLNFLGAVAQAIPPYEAVESINLQAPASRFQVVQAAARAAGSHDLTEQQASYAAYATALQVGLNRTEAALCALEVGTNESNALAHLMDVLHLFEVEPQQARSVLAEVALRLPRRRVVAWRQGFRRSETLDQGSRQLLRSAALTAFEGTSAYTHFHAEAELSRAIAAARDAGAQGGSVMTYLVASGFSDQEALLLLEAASGAKPSGAARAAGARFYESLRPQVFEPLAAEWFEAPGAPGTPLKLQQADGPYVLESSAAFLGVDASQVLFQVFDSGLQLPMLASCSFNLVVEAPDATLLARLQNLSSSYESFRSQLQQVWPGPLPSCFRGAARMSLNVQVREMELPVSKWLVTDWSTCPATCDVAWQNRAVQCSSGNEFACNAAGAKPDSEQRCEVCPFQLTCPLGGPNSTLDCSWQLAFAIGLVCLSTLVCVCLILLLCMMTWRPQGGQLELVDQGGEKMKVDFYIMKEVGSTQSSQEKAKCHVVWDVDVEKAQKLEIHESKMTHLAQVAGMEPEKRQRFMERLPKAPEGNETERRLREQEILVEVDERSRSQASSPSKSRSPRSVSRTLSRSASNASFRGGVEEYTPYWKGSRVEYYSVSTARWLPADVLSYSSEGFELQLVGARATSTAQLRHSVPLELLREPLMEGELVSVFSTVQQQWYYGQILSKAQPSVSVVGYTVKIVGEEEVLKNVPAQNVWRRYPEGTAVDVFHDNLGWMQGTVLADAEMTEPLPVKDAVPSWYSVRVSYDHDEDDEVPGYRVQRQVLTL